MAIGRVPPLINKPWFSKIRGWHSPKKSTDQQDSQAGAPGYKFVYNL